MPGMFVNGEWITEKQRKNTDGRFVSPRRTFGIGSRPTEIAASRRTRPLSSIRRLGVSLGP